MRVLPVAVAFMLAAGPLALAEEPPPKAPGPASPRASPEVGAADAVLSALQGGDTATLQTLAAAQTPDPWMVADELVSRGRVDAARQFAAADRSPALVPLVTYLQQEHLPDGGHLLRQRLALANAALQREAWGEALEALGEGGGDASELQHVAGIRCAMGRAIAHQRLGQPQQATIWFERAADAAGRLGWAARRSRALGAAVNTRFSSGDASGARKLQERALKEAEERGDALAIAMACGDLGTIVEVLGEYQLSVELQLRSLRLAREAGSEPATLRALASLGLPYMKMADWTKALDALTEAEAMAIRLGDRSVLAQVRANIGLIQEELGRYELAEAAYEGARAEFEAMGDQLRGASCLMNLGNIHRRRGDHERAAEYTRKAVEIIERSGTTNGLADALSSLGGDLDRARDHEGAHRALERALRLHEEQGNRAGAAILLTNLGQHFADLGDLAKALAYFRRGLVHARRPEGRPLLGLILRNIGSVHERLGEYAAALDFHEESLDAEVALGRPAEIAHAQGSLGRVRLLFGDYGGGLDALGQSYKALVELGERSEALGVLDSMAFAEAQAGRMQEALDLFAQAQKGYAEAGDRRGAAIARLNAAQVRFKAGDSVGALADLEASLTPLEATGDLRNASLVRIQRGGVLTSLGRLEEAREDVEAGVRWAVENHAAHMNVAGQVVLAQIALSQGKAGEALLHAQLGVSDAENLLVGLGQEDGALARGALHEVFMVGALAAMRLGDTRELCQFMERGRAGALMDALGKRDLLRVALEEVPAGVRAAGESALMSETSARLALESALGSGDAAATASARAALGAATEAVRRAQARIDRAARRRAGLPYFRPASLDTIRAALGEGEVLVSFAVSETHTLALVIDASGARHLDLGPPEPLARLVRSLDARAAGMETEEARKALQAALVSPLALPATTARVLITGEQFLLRVPWPLLVETPIAVLPSASTLVYLRADTPTQGTGILGFGDPDYRAQSTGSTGGKRRRPALRALPATRHEVATTATSAFLGPAATEANLRSQLTRGERWRALHVAAHGLLDEERPYLSAIALAPDGDDDGYVRVLDVVRLEVSADLVVLSACDSGGGTVAAGEGLLGLARAFMHSGTSRIICSLWKVDDAATGALMVKFYELWAPKDGTQGLPTAVALREAQQFVASQDRWKHPYYWAAWMLWGLPE